MQTDLYQKITDKIVADLEQGTRPWAKSWNSGRKTMYRPLRHNGIPYSGINVLILWSEADAKGYTNPHWLTFKQALDLGAHVRKGEKGTTIVYADRFIPDKERQRAKEANEDPTAIPFLKAYTVFNAEQIENLPDQYRQPTAIPNQCQKIEHAETFFRNTGAHISHGGDKAFYMPSQDRIQMPGFESFKDAESYYATLAHEATHWTGAKHRLDRIFGKRFGDEHYAAEELVAELGAAFLCADLGLSLEPRDDHSSYIAGWLKVLKNDKRAIFTASSMAEKAAKYLADKQSTEQQLAA
jgi:antirestriction protein ArdC